MGYAGICAPNVQNNSDDHFHAISIQEMTNNIENGSGGNCPVLTPLGNTGPSVTTLAADYSLPVSTPFFLTAIATDPDGDELTYCWEQMDNQIATQPPLPTNTGGPAFRSNSPVLSPTRYFPNLGAVISGTTPTWEVIPSVSRNMNFRVSVRDNFMGGGCVNSTNVSLSFTNQAGPFVVLNPNTAVSWTTGTPQTITWNVANTDQAPVSCDLVDIYLSLDGGLSYPVQLADDVPNTGAYNLLVPNEPTTQARVQVVCADNIFFDISDENFEIVQPAEPTFLASVSPAVLSQCVANSDPEFTISLVGLAGFSEPVTFSVAGLPTGVTATFTPDPAAPGNDATLTLSDFQSAMPGEYTLEITCTAPSVSQTVTAVLNIILEAPSAVALEEPADGSQGHPLNALLSWDPTFFASSYLVEISTSPAFGADVIETATVSSPSYEATQLQPFTLYFWRVTAANDCGNAPPQEAFVFQTGGSLCTPYVDDNPGLVIPGNQTGSWSATLNIGEDIEIDDINILVNLQHTWIGDVAATVEGPAGQSVTLFDQPGVPASQYGCGEDNLFVIFDDEADLTAADLENTCGAGPYAIQGPYQPVDPLSVFDGSSSQGDWTITLSDIFDQDGGNLVFWSLVICRQPLTTNLVEVSNNPLLVANGAAGNILNAFLEYERVGINPAQITYMLLELPAHGQLLAGGSPLDLGATFTQAQINAMQLVYQHDGSAPLTDAFRFHVYDNEGGWIQNAQFDIQIVSEVPLSGFTFVDGEILCHGDATGNIEVQAFGGVPPYQYSLNGGPFQSENLFEGLPAGMYEIEVVDNLGNQLLLPAIEFTQPDLLEANAALSGNTLEGTATGGTAPYAYSLDGVDYQPEGLFEGLPNGDYTLYVQDANGCQATAAFSVNLILSAAVESGDVSCFGDSDGFIAVTSVNGGESPYTYSLNGGTAQSDPLFENLPAGAYDLLIEDNQGQTFELTGIVIGGPSELLFDVTVMGDTIDIAATGGTPPYLYSLDGGQTFSEDAIFTGLANGDYDVLVRDADDCLSAIQVVTVLISGIADLQAAWQLRLLPNPTSGAFSLEGVDADARQLSWQVVDLPGRVLYSGELNTAAGYWSQAFDLPLPPGAYWLRVVSAAHGSAVLPLVVVK
jgi:subtilisin-like proprotein convertase family protein